MVPVYRPLAHDIQYPPLLGSRNNPAPHPKYGKCAISRCHLEQQTPYLRKSCLVLLLILRHMVPNQLIKNTPFLCDKAKLIIPQVGYRVIERKSISIDDCSTKCQALRHLQMNPGVQLCRNAIRDSSCGRGSFPRAAVSGDYTIGPIGMCDDDLLGREVLGDDMTSHPERNFTLPSTRISLLTNCPFF